MTWNIVEKLRERARGYREALKNSKGSCATDRAGLYARASEAETCANIVQEDLDAMVPLARETDVAVSSEGS